MRYSSGSLQEPGGHAGQADERGRGAGMNCRPRSFLTGYEIKRGGRRTTAPMAQIIGFIPMICSGTRKDGFGNGFDGRHNVPEKCRDLFDDDQHADRHQHAFDHRDGKK